MERRPRLGPERGVFYTIILLFALVGTAGLLLRVQRGGYELPDVGKAVGCTRNVGYWRTHSKKGPAEYNPVWDSLPLGADTPFASSNKTYYEVLWSKTKGNAYYVLAPQYIATKLNAFNGAIYTTDVKLVMDESRRLFHQYTADEAAELKGKKGNGVRERFTSLASVLEEYNKGEAGVLPCSN